MTDTRDRKSRSLFGLVGDVPKLVKGLVKGEIDLLKAEMLAKAKIFCFWLRLETTPVMALWY